MNLAFRVDYSSQIGSGHFMRCLTLANEALSKGFRSSFLMRDPDAQIISKVESSGHEIHLLFGKDQGNYLKKRDLAHSNWLPVTNDSVNLKSHALSEGE